MTTLDGGETLLVLELSFEDLELAVNLSMRDEVSCGSETSES